MNAPSHPRLLRLLHRLRPPAPLSSLSPLTIVLLSPPSTRPVFSHVDRASHFLRLTSPTPEFPKHTDSTGGVPSHLLRLLRLSDTRRRSQRVWWSSHLRLNTPPSPFLGIQLTSGFMNHWIITVSGDITPIQSVYGITGACVSIYPRLTFLLIFLSANIMWASASCSEDSQLNELSNKRCNAEFTHLMNSWTKGTGKGNIK